MSTIPVEATMFANAAVVSPASGFVGWFGGLPGEVQAVLIGWLGFAFVYFVRPILDERREQDRRRQRVLNLLQIVRLEIEQTRRSLSDTFSAEMLEIIARNLTDETTRSAYVPFLSFVPMNPIIDAVSDDVHLLERQFGDQLLNYNENDALLSAMIMDMRTETFARMDPARRLAFVRHMFDHVERQKTLIDALIARFKSSRDLVRA